MNEKRNEDEDDTEAMVDGLAKEMAKLAVRGAELLHEVNGLKVRKLRQRLQLIDMQKDMERIRVYKMEMEKMKKESEKKKKKSAIKASEVSIERIRGDVRVMVGNSKIIHHLECHILKRMNGREMQMNDARAAGYRLSEIHGGCCRRKFGDHMV